MSRIVGIDLGTTNSLVAYVDGAGVPRVIPDAEGRRLLPSIVAYTPAGVVVGEAARRQLARNPARTVYSVKRFMGRGWEDVREEARHVPFEIVPSAEVVRIRAGDREVTPPEVSAQILRALKLQAEAHLGEPVERAVITVPAYFNDAQRQATKDAGRIAGLEVLRIVNEPTAASLAYGLQKLAQGVIAVYDLGGGTFDISILRVKDGVFEVLATNGDTHLGGDDFDRAVVQWLLEDIRRGARRGSLEGPRGAAGAATRRRGRQVPALVRGADGADHPVRRASPTGARSRAASSKALIGSLVDATLGPCRMALKDAGLATDAIDEIVLVGGSTRVPLVRQRVGELFGKTPHSQLNPDEVVALGAAVQAQILAGGITRHAAARRDAAVARDRDAGRHRQRADPAQHDHSHDGQGVLHHLGGRPDRCGHARAAGRARAGQGQPLARALRPRRRRPMPAGMPKIEVTFLIDANGILQVQAKELRSGKAASIEVKPAYGLSEAQVAQMVEDSFTYAEADVNARLLIETKTEAETVMNHVRRALKQGGHLVNPQELHRIAAAVDALRAVECGTDRDAIRERTIDLNKATEPLAEAMMDAAIRGAVTSKRADQILEQK